MAGSESGVGTEDGGHRACVSGAILAIGAEMPITRDPSTPQPPTRDASRARFSSEELHAALSGPRVSNEERERRNPELAHMRQKAKAALRDLQEKGILDEGGRLIPMKELPVDCRPESETEC